MPQLPYIAVNDIRKVLGDRGIDPDLACEGLDLAAIRGPFERARWAEVCVLLERGVNLLGGDQALRIASAECDRSTTFLPQFISRITDLRIAYMIGCRWLGPLIYPVARAHDRTIAEGRYEQVVEVLPQYQDSRAFFFYLQGMLESVPTVVGSARPVVELEVAPRWGRYSIVFADVAGDEPDAHEAFDAIGQFLTLVGRLPDARINATSVEHETDVVQQVYDALGSDLQVSTPSQAWVARRLGMSERSLKRRLQERQTSFRELREAQLLERSRMLLRDGLSVESVAEVLGFSEARAFRRAYKRWTGQSPSAFRSST